MTKQQDERAELTKEEKALGAFLSAMHDCKLDGGKMREAMLKVLGLKADANGEEAVALTFKAFRAANVSRCIKWHPAGIASWSPSDWMTAVVGELGELGSLLKMRNRERDGLPGNKFSPTQKQIADELADVLTYLDLLAEVLGVDLGAAAVEKFNEVSERVGFPDRIVLSASPAAPEEAKPKRTLLEQYDREQQPGYRDGYEDGRLKGYDVGLRHGAEHAANPKQPSGEQQAQAGEPKVAADVTVNGIYRTLAGIDLPVGTQLITLQSYREAVAKKDAALKTVVDFGEIVNDLLRLLREGKPYPVAYIQRKLDAAITQALEALK